MSSILKKFNSKKLRSRIISYTMVTILFIVLQSLVSANLLPTLIKNLLVPICCYITAALALNLVVGVLGDLSLGQAGFMSIGAFAGILISTILAKYVDSIALRLVSALLFGAIISGLCGVIIGIPVLKLEGDYLAIVTLAFGQIVKSLIGNIFIGIDSSGLKFSMFTNNMNLLEDGKLILGGPAGSTGVNRIASFTAGFILVMITLTVIYNLIHSKEGRSIMACRDNKIAAESIGINVSKYKLMAFVISAALAGSAGALYGLNYSSITPAKFDFNQSILILVFVVLGGLGNMNGTIVSTIVLILLPELLREFKDYRMLVYAIVLIFIMLVTNNHNLKAKIASIKQRLFTKKGKGR